MPRVDTPVYNATKAAVRSFTMSLRQQLRGTGVRVVEMIPPAVQSELHDFQGPSGREVTHDLIDLRAQLKVSCSKACAPPRCVLFLSARRRRKLVVHNLARR